MSRSALWHQEVNVQKREREAHDTFQAALEEGRNNRSKGTLPLWGPDDTFNINPALLGNIVKSPYFLKCCTELHDWNAVVDEIYYEVKHMEPHTIGASKTPSTAFCLLVRLFTLRCTEKQMKLMLDHVDSPYIRCVGFLYLRYASNPEGLWTWVEPYLYDDEIVKIEQRPGSAGRNYGGRGRGGNYGGGGARNNDLHEEMTVGKYVRQLIETNQYHGTLLPRLPVTIEREIKVKLLQAEKMEDRAKKHWKNSRSMDYFRKLGSHIKALYGDDENPVTWYDAIVDRVITKHEETGADLSRPKFVVTFTEYGNTETVTLGEIDFRDAPGTGGAGSGGGYDRRGGGAHANDRGLDDYFRRNNDHWDNPRGYSGRDDHRSRGCARGDDRRDRDRWDRDGDRDRDFNRGRDRYGGGRPRSRSRDRSDDPYDTRTGGAAARSTTGSSELDERSLMDEVLRREREKSTASGKAYAARPPTCKTSLAGDSLGARDGDRQNRSSYEYADIRGHSNDSRNIATGSSQHPSSSSVASSTTVPPQSTRKKTPEELAVFEDKKRKLMAKYG